MSAPSLVRRFASVIRSKLGGTPDAALDRMLADERRLTEQIGAAAHWRRILANTGLPADGFSTGLAASNALAEMTETRRRLRNRISYYRRQGKAPSS